MFQLFAWPREGWRTGLRQLQLQLLNLWFCITGCASNHSWLFTKMNRRLVQSSPVRMFTSFGTTNVMTRIWWLRQLQRLGIRCGSVLFRGFGALLRADLGQAGLGQAEPTQRFALLGVGWTGSLTTGRSSTTRLLPAGC